MVLARRLLGGGGGTGGFTPPVPAAFTITASPAGGAIVVNQPWAVYDAAVGKTFLAYLRGNNGNIEVVSYDHASHTTSSPFVLHSALQVDAHAAPAILVLASGKLVVAYSRHDGSAMFVRRSTNGHDATAWETEQSLTLSGTDITYPNLFELTSEGALYLVYRGVWDPATLCYTKSTDGGVTWGAQTPVYRGGTGTINGYWHAMCNGIDRMDFAVTNITPNAVAHANLYHFYYQGGAYYKSDGTLISTSLPIGPSDCTTIVTGATVNGGCFPFDLSPIGPTVALCVYKNGGTDDGYYDCRWTGSAWQVTLITNAGGVFYGAQSPGLSVDYADPDRYVCVLSVAGSWQAFAYSTPDHGLTWTQDAQLTSTSSPVNHVWPQSVWNHAPDLRTVWLEGTYTNDNTWATGISGVNR